MCLLLFIPNQVAQLRMQLKQNRELQERIKKNAGFADKLAQNQLKFKQLEQLALYSSLEEPAPMIIPMQYTDHQAKINLLIVLGIRQPQGPKAIEKILLSIVSMVPKPQESYSVVYVNTLADGNAYTDFKKIMQFLPQDYFIQLERIYVLQANFKSKANYWISFDYLTNYLKGKTTHVGSFKELAEKAPIKPEVFLKFLPDQIVEQLTKKEEIVRQILEVKKVKKNIVFNPKIYNIEQEAYVQKKPALLTMSSSLKPASKTIQQYEVGRTGAPLMMEMLISYFNGKEHLLDSEGLFRKSVSIEEETALLKQLNNENYDCLQNIEDPHLIANVIKRFLSNLAEPIISYLQFNDLMETHQDLFVDKILQIVAQLKENRKITLLLLVDFLKEKLLARTQLNKMTQNSLSIVLGPCFMHSQTPSMKDILFTKKSISATLIIFKEFDKIFGHTQQRTALIRKSICIQERRTLRQRLEEEEAKQNSKQEGAHSILFDLIANGEGYEDTRSSFQQGAKEEINFFKKQEVSPTYGRNSMSFNELTNRQSFDEFE